MKKINGNRLMLNISTIMVILMVVIYLAHNQFSLLKDYAFLMGIDNLSTGMSTLLYIFLSVPVVLLIVSFFVYRKDQHSEKLPLLLTLTFTFTSIGMIAAGNGFVEYHFSIFMMLALISFFRSIKLTTISTLIFALQHFIGYFLFPELLCGTSDYKFVLLMIHAIYLILSALANGVLILHTNRTAEEAETIRNEVNQRFKEVIQQLDGTSHAILNVSSEVDQTIAETEKVSLTISDSSGNLYQGAEEMQRSVEENVAYIEHLLNVTDALNESADIINHNTMKTAEDVKSGADSITTAEEQFVIVKNSVDHLESLITGFQKTINQIGRFVTEISDIADQTNLLALNASIEAARAGESGKGFAVVAGEVRKLANESDASAHNIHNLVTSIEKEAGVIQSEMEVCVNEVDNGTHSIGLSKDSFKAITLSVNDVIKEMKGILNVSKTLSADGIKMNQSMQEMNAFSEESLNNSREIAVASELQFERAASLKAISTQLRTESSHLEQLVKEINKYEENA